MALPIASAQTTVMVTIPSGASIGQSAAPGFSPANVTVVIGVNNTVTWTNDDTADHTVYSTSVPTGASAFNSPIMVAGATYTHAFTVPGTYQYHCNLHPAWMQGSVTVKAASTTTTPEFPVASLAVTLFAVIAAVMLIVPRLRPMLTAASGTGTTSGRVVSTAC